MAYYAKVVNNKVVENIKISDEFEKDAQGNIVEALGAAWCRNHMKDPDGLWIKTSFNSNRGVYYKNGTNIPHEDQSKLLRKTFAQIDFDYDPVNDWFKPNKTLPSFVWSEEHWDYRPPQSVPNDGQQYDWNEDQYNATGNGWVVRPS
jgi:hypothetical protein